MIIRRNSKDPGAETEQLDAYRERVNSGLSVLFRHYTAPAATILGLLAVFGTTPPTNSGACVLWAGGSVLLLTALLTGCWCSWTLYRVEQKKSGKTKRAASRNWSGWFWVRTTPKRIPIRCKSVPHIVVLGRCILTDE